MGANVGHPALLARAAQPHEHDVGTGRGNAGSHRVGSLGAVEAREVVQGAGRHEAVAGAGNAQARPGGADGLEGARVGFGRGAVQVDGQAFALGAGTEFGHEFGTGHPLDAHAIEDAGTDAGANAVGDEHVGLLQQLANDGIPVRLHGFLGIHGKHQRRATARAAACLDQVDTVVGDLLHGLDDDVLMEQPCGSGFAGHRFLWRKLKRPWEGLDGYRPLRPARGRTGLRDVFRPFLAAGAGLSDCPNLSCLPRPDHPQM